MSYPKKDGIECKILPLLVTQFCFVPLRYMFINHKLQGNKLYMQLLTLTTRTIGKEFMEDYKH